MPKLSELSDHLELSTLAATYAIAADNRDAAEYVGTFLPDGKLHVFYPQDIGSPSLRFEGHGQLAAVTSRLTELYDQTFHFVGQAVHNVEGNKATGLVYCLAHHLTTTKAGVTDLVLHMRYDDICHRDSSGAWRFAQRIARVGWTEFRPVHVAPAPLADDLDGDSWS